jgi:glycosyltransferase involved in cell wall biosynthesis
MKGFRHLIGACAHLRERGCEFACTVVGEGPERGRLEALIARLGLEAHVELVGAKLQEEIAALYRESDLFALACVEDGEGGMDGIPVALMEAMANGLAVVSSALAGIPELIETEVHGVLTQPGEEIALADALQRLIDAPALRREMGARGREKVVAEFDVRRSAEQLLARFSAGQGGAF